MAQCKDEEGEEQEETEEAPSLPEIGSSTSVITPLLSATSLPPVPPPTSSPSVNFLDDAVPPAPTWDTLKDEKVPEEVSVLASVGSALHGTGNCKPCAWFWKPQAGKPHPSGQMMNYIIRIIYTYTVQTEPGNKEIGRDCVAKVGLMHRFCTAVGGSSVDLP